MTANHIMKKLRFKKKLEQVLAAGTADQMLPFSSMYLVTFADGSSTLIVTLGIFPEAVRPRNITDLFADLNTSTSFSMVLYLLKPIKA